jgi:hypothetical protein
MKHQSVKSSNIASIAYDDASRELEIKFKDGGTYRYADVEPRTHQQMLNASSIGSFFHQHIKPKKGRAV